MPRASSASGLPTGIGKGSDRRDGNRSRPRSRSIPPRELNWSELSDNAARIIVEIAIPIWQGYSHADIGSRLGKSEAWVAVQIAELRREIVEQGAEFRGIDPLVESLREAR
jgi:hypothetical protein